MTNSKQKGKRGELEFAHYLQDKGFQARRSQQYCGTESSADIISDSKELRDFHFEVKRTERFNIYGAFEQAQNDCGNHTPIVVHRRNRGGWLAILSCDDLVNLIKQINKGDNT